MSLSENCARCSSSIGDDAKVQPINCDGDRFCPRCFVWWRMHQPEESGTHGMPRFNASQTCVARCQFCHWTVVSFGAQPGQRLFCSHCTKPGCQLVKREDKAFTKEELEAIAEAGEMQRKIAESRE